MTGKQKGFTLIEILVVVTIIGVLAGLVVVLIPRTQEQGIITECSNNVRNIVGLLVAADKPYELSGPNMALYFVKGGDFSGKNLKILFCPGDKDESLEKAGGEEAYKGLDLRSRQYDNLTSYAGRDQENKNCRVAKGSTEPAVMICDDDETHHNRKGFVCGYNSGSVEFRKKVDHWERDVSEVVEIGEGSTVDELKCLRRE